MFRFTEEILLVFLDEEAGGLEKIPAARLNMALAGAVLMDLATEHRVDTDPARITLLDATPTGDRLLDTTLGEIAREHDHESPRDVPYWLQRIARRGRHIRDRALKRLAKAKILESDAPGSQFLADHVRRSRTYTSEGGEAVEDVRLRIMRALFTEEVPDPRDAAIIALVDACGQFDRLLWPEELEDVRPRIDLLSRMDLIGRAVAGAIRDLSVEDEDVLDVPSALDGLKAGSMPEIKGLPLLGSALKVQANAIGFLTECYREHGPVFKFKLLNREFVGLAGPEANDFMARDGKLCLSTHWTWQAYVNELGARRDVINMDGAEHIRIRRALNWGYSKEIYEREIKAAVSITRAHLGKLASSKPVDVYRMLQHLVIQQIGSIAGGFNPAGWEDDLIEYFDIVLATTVARIKPRFPYSRRIKKLAAKLDGLFQQHVADRKNRPQPAGRGDLVDDILALHRQDPQFLPESEFRVLFLAPFVAGLDTAAGTMTFMLYVLMRDPELMARLRAEVGAIFDSGCPTAADMRRMDVTNRLAMETLRRYPLGSVQIRAASNTFHFAGCTIPARSSVMVATAVTHFLPEFFPDPYTFDIDRYLPDRAEHRQRNRYTPFGLGPHRCLGAGFAESLIALTMATIVHETDPEFGKANYRMRTKSVPTLRPANKFLVRFPPRAR